MSTNGKPVQAHISGTVWRIDVAVGAEVKEGESVVTLESMKMELPVEAPCAGRISELKVEKGQFVSEGDVVALIA
jgi:acetyl-CoA carboxylase biotin carboxyl carrier protein